VLLRETHFWNILFALSGPVEGYTQAVPVCNSSRLQGP